MPELIPAEPGSPEWLAARRAGVTATDIVTIIGLSRYDSVYSLFWRKLGQVPEVEDSDRFRLGRVLQSYIFDRWKETSPDSWFTGELLVRNSERAWQMATVDALVASMEIYAPEAAEAVLELKSWADAGKRAWETGPPPAVRAQVLWQMDVMDVAAGHVGVVFLPSGEFRSYTIDHTACEHVPGQNPAEICSICWDLCLMRAAGEEFMARLRLELPPPDPDSSAATLAAVRARFAKVPAKQAEVELGLWNAWYGAKSEVDRWTELVCKYEIRLREQAGEAAEYTVDGQVVARRVISDAPVKAHVRHQDYLRRVKQQGDDE